MLEDGSYLRTAEVADDVLEAYKQEKYDAVYLVYNEFKSAIQQQVTVERLIPVSTDVPDGLSQLL